MLDINGHELREGDAAQLLCEVIVVDEKFVAVRVMNSEMMLQIDAKQDEVLGGLVVGSELTKFVEIAPSVRNLEKDAEISRSAGSGATFE